jgi:hypothetical protein
VRSKFEVADAGSDERCEYVDRSPDGPEATIVPHSVPQRKARALLEEVKLLKRMARQQILDNIE